MGSTEELGSGDDLLQQAFPGARRTTKKKVSADEEPSDTPWKNSGYDPWSRRTSVNISASVALFNVIDPEKASHGHGIHAIYDQGDAPWLITERRVANSVTGAMDIDEEDEDETTPAPANAAALSSAALAAVKNYGRREVPTYKAEEILEDGEDDEMEQEEVQSSKTSTISLIRGSESSLMTGDLQEGETQEEAVLDQGSVESDIYESYGAFGMIDSKSSSPIEKFQTEPEPAVAKSTANVFLKSAAASSHSLRPKPKSSTGTAMPSVERLNDSDAVHLPENDDGFKIIFPLSIQTEAATGRVKDMRYPVLSLCEERAQRGIDPWVAANRDVLPILASMLKEQDAAAQVERERRARRGKEKARDMSVLDMNVVMESTVASGVGVGSGPVKDAQPMSAEVIPRSKAKSVVWPRDFLQVNGVIEEGRASVRREVDRSMAKLNAGVSERLSTRKSIFESWSSSRTQNPPVVRHAPSAPRLYALRIRVSSAFSRIPQASARARPRTSMVAMAVAGTSTSIGVEAHMRRAAVSGRLPKEENPTCSLISADRSASMLPNSMTYVLSEQEAEMIVSRTENAPAEDAKLKLAVEGANFSKSVRIDESSLVKPGWRDVNARLTRSTGGARRLVISPGKRSQSSRELLLRCPSVAEQDSYEKEDLDVLVDWEDTSSSVSNEGTHVESETKAEEEEGAPNTMDVTQKPPKIPRLNAPASEEKGLTSASGDSLRSGGGGSIQSESRYSLTSESGNCSLSNLHSGPGSIHEYGTSRQASETTLPDTTSPSNDAIEQSDPATDRLSNSALDREPHPAVDRSGNPYPKGVYRIPVNPPDVKVHRTKLKSVFSTQWVDSVECAGWGADVTPRLSKRSSRVECKLPLTATPTNSANVYRRPLPLAGEADFVTGPENEKGQKIIKPRPRDPDGDQVYREKSAPIPDAAEVPIPATTEPPPELETVEVMEQSVKPAEQPKWHRKEQSAAPRKPVRIMNIQLPLLDSPARTSQPRVRVRLDQKEDPDNFDARKDKFAPGKALMKPFAYTPLQSKLAIVAPRLHPKLFMTLRPLSTLKMYEAAHQGTIGRAGTPAALEESPSPYLAAERLNPTPEGLELPPGTPTDAPSATATSPEPSLHEQADQRRQETEAIPAKDLASDSDLISVLSAVPTASPNHRLQSPTPSTFTVVSRFNGPNLPLTSPTPWGRSRPSTAATEREEPVKKAPPRSSTFLNRPAGVPRVSNT